MLAAEMFRNAFNINTALWVGRAPARHKRTKARNPLGNHYKCGDGKWILLSEIQNQRFWPYFCKAMDLQDLENDSRFSSMKARSENCEELIRILDEKFATKPRDEWAASLNQMGGGMSFCIINRIEDLITDPSVNKQVMANNYIMELDDPRMDHPLTDKVMAIGCPFQFSETPVKGPLRRAPEYGEHTEVVLQNILGLSMQEIEKLRSKGIIGAKID
jgi:crotonobetainyl-CoA:carnitine CoA-transferase CaiB-like acyl-CoA transferase